MAAAALIRVQSESLIIGNVFLECTLFLEQMILPETSLYFIVTMRRGYCKRRFSKHSLQSFLACVCTSLSRLVPAAVVGLSSGVYGLKRLLNTSEMPRTDLPIPDGFGWPHH